MKFLFVVVIKCLLLLAIVPAHAQLLPDNSNLNTASVSRWMNSNRAMAPLVQAIDAYFLTPESLKSFEALSPLQQDQTIERLLSEVDLLAQAHVVVREQGWKSVGEYMRLSTKLGNAIAAYFLLGDLGKLSSEQVQQLKEKTDPAILAVPQADIEFVRRHEKMLQQYIKAYGAGQ